MVLKAIRGLAMVCFWPILLKKLASIRAVCPSPQKRLIYALLREIWSGSGAELAQIARPAAQFHGQRLQRDFFKRSADSGHSHRSRPEYGASVAWSMNCTGGPRCLAAAIHALLCSSQFRNRHPEALGLEPASSLHRSFGSRLRLQSH